MHRAGISVRGKVLKMPCIRMATEHVIRWVNYRNGLRLGLDSLLGRDGGRDRLRTLDDAAMEALLLRDLVRAFAIATLLVPVTAGKWTAFMRPRTWC